MSEVYLFELFKDAEVGPETWTGIDQVPYIRYRAVEDRYVAAIEHMMREHRVSRGRLFLNTYEPKANDLARYAPDIPAELARSFREGEWAEGARLVTFCRLALRGLVGWAFSNECDFLVFFGYDMTTTIGAPVEHVKAEGWVQWPGMAAPLHALPAGRMGVEVVDEIFPQLLPRAPVTA